MWAEGRDGAVRRRGVRPPSGRPRRRPAPRQARAGATRRASCGTFPPPWPCAAPLSDRATAKRRGAGGSAAWRRWCSLGQRTAASGTLLHWSGQTAGPATCRGRATGRARSAPAGPESRSRDAPRPRPGALPTVHWSGKQPLCRGLVSRARNRGREPQQRMLRPAGALRSRWPLLRPYFPEVGVPHPVLCFHRARRPSPRLSRGVESLQGVARSWGFGTTPRAHDRPAGPHRWKGTASRCGWAA